MNQVLTLDPGGRPSRWADWEDALVYKVKGLIVWSLGEEVAYRGGHCRASGEDSIVMVPNIIAVKNEVLDNRVALNNQNLFHRDGHMCGYCGGRFHRSELTREHIIPVSRGGLDVWSNCIAACKLWPPKNLPVGCVSEFRIRSREKNPVGGTRGHHQFGLRVRGRV